MPRFFAMTAVGLADALEAELRELGVGHPRVRPGGVDFQGTWEDCYRANLWLRCATRVVLPVSSFTAGDGEALYHHIRKHDFTQYIEPDGTFAVNAAVRTPGLRDQRYVAMKIKDAVADQFRERFGRRPNVNLPDPDLLILAHSIKERIFISIDTSGTPLFKRGYRTAQVPAPLKEHMAAALLAMSGWKRDRPVVDLMCGSGTLPIEAALAALNIPPGGLRKAFGFQRLKNYQPEAWRRITQAAAVLEKDHPGLRCYGFDIDAGAVRAARANAEMAGVEGWIDFRQMDVADVQPPCDQGVIIINPPYGERLGTREDLGHVFRQLGKTLKERFKGWECWLLSGDAQLVRYLGLKSDRKFKVLNGPIECRFLKYSIRD